MTIRSVVVSMSSVVLLVSFGLAQNYQAGKILSISKHESRAASGGTDSQNAAPIEDYDVTISSGGTVYTTIYHHPGELEPAWSEGKEVQVHVAGKVLHVKKANGKPESLRIVKRKPEGS